MVKKAKRPRGSNDPALSGFKALQHVIEATEGTIEKTEKSIKRKSAKRR